MTASHSGRRSLVSLIERIDAQSPGGPALDTVPTGFPSLDKVLGGGVRRRDLILLGGDVASGKSALALGIALRVARGEHTVALLSGEMDEDRLLERVLAMEGRATVDDLRSGALSDAARAAVGSAALRLEDLTLAVHPIAGAPLEATLQPVWDARPHLIVLDYVQLVANPTRPTVAEADAATLRALKATALERDVAVLAVTQLPRLDPQRDDPRPTPDDYGAEGAAKQHADVMLSLYREEMYRRDPGVEGAAELYVSKNRHGPTGFIDLFFYKAWMRFEDVMDG